MKEIIAACGFETWTPAVGQYSFTRALIDELTRWSHHTNLTAATLHGKIVTRMKDWPRFEPTTRFELRKTPVHITISDKGAGRSIGLSPRPLPLYELASDLSTGEDSATTSTSAAQESSSLHAESSQSSQSSLGQIWPDEDFKHSRVLVSLLLEEDQWMDTGQWIKWIESVPATVKYTRVQGVYKSASTLLLLSMPIPIWNMLASDPAVTFVSFVRSDNLLESRSVPSNTWPGVGNDLTLDDYRSQTPRPGASSVTASTAPPNIVQSSTVDGEEYISATEDTNSVNIGSDYFSQVLDEVSGLPHKDVDTAMLDAVITVLKACNTISRGYTRYAKFLGDWNADQRARAAVSREQARFDAVKGQLFEIMAHGNLQISPRMVACWKLLLFYMSQMEEHLSQVIQSSEMDTGQSKGSSEQQDIAG